MKESAFKLAHEWASNTYFDESDRKEIQDLLKDSELNELEILERFHQNLEFGTGGLRSIRGMGSNRMNKYNVRKAAQAMADVLKAEFKNDLRVAISFDNRHCSELFAKEAASVFAGNKIKTYLYKELAPTPMLSFAVRYHKCQAGIMMTASHNPKQYNGLKAYWDDGSQVTPPYDQKIIDAYNAIHSWEEISFLPLEQALKEEIVEYVKREVDEAFYQEVEKAMVNRELSLSEGSKVQIAFTPLHGCSYLPCKEVSARLGYKNFHIIKEQAVFDPDFSTVSTTPNPEDPKALELAVNAMLEQKMDVAYGSDPDGDRLGVVVNHKQTPHYLNGNQIAFLMLHYLFEQHQKRGTLPLKPLVLKSIVTSDLQNNIAARFGGEVKETLTGFKWMARAWRDLELAGTDFTYFFASEESFGYMPRNHVRDKDAVTSIALMNEITLYYKLKGMTLIEALDEIYEIYGFAQESLIALNYEGLAGKQKIEDIMTYFRTKYGAHIGNERISLFKDYNENAALDLATGKMSSLNMTKSNVLGFEFESGNKLYVRPSGTEPKIKFYTMVKVEEGDLKTKKDLAQRQINEMEEFIMKTVKGI